jgi:DNA-binding response OmpR family regulator
MARRVAIVEDDAAIRANYADMLKKHGYQVSTYADRKSAAAGFRTRLPDLALLDIGLADEPDGGFTLCRELRAAGSDVPVLMLTARDAVDARVEGLDAGADGYLTQPFEFRERIARVRALTRRERRPLTPQRVTIGHLTIDLVSKRVWRRAAEVSLTTREFALLEFLVRRVGEVVGRAEIAEHVWDEHYEPFSNVVDVYVQRLRRKLDEPHAESLIRTRRGLGYQLL